MMAAAVLGGLGGGVLVALVLEIFGRRVRSTDDLGTAVGAPVLAVIRGRVKAKRPIWRLPSLLRPRGGRAQVASA